LLTNVKADAPELFEIPARGRHYQDVWDEEDGLPAGTTPHHPISASPKSGRVPPHLSHFVPANDLKDEALAHERGLGVMTERIVAAVQAEGHLVIREGGGGEVREREKGEKLDVAKIDVVELEERMKRELRAVMLLGEHEEVRSHLQTIPPTLTV
jgi:transcriptional adapter 3